MCFRTGNQKINTTKMATTGIIQAVSLLLCVLAISANEAKDASNGWGDAIEWQTFEDGEKLSAETNKPMMLVIHKSWCGACKALKPRFSESAAIQELSSNFVMVNTLDDEEPKDAKFSPDGGYIPRVVFVDPSGTVLEKFFNEGGNPSYKYYYPNPENIAKTMDRVSQELSASGKPNKEL